MQRDDFLCALDLTDTQPLSRDARIQVKGWVISTQGAEIREVALRINGGRPIRAAYPEPRPDVASYYPQFEKAGSSGFAAQRIRLEYGKDRTLDIEVIVDTKDGSSVIHERRVQLLWFDPKTDLFRLGRIGPFAYPDAFDETRLPTFAAFSPTFVLGSRTQIADASSALGGGLEDGRPFVEMLAAIVACHDGHTDFSRAFMAHFRNQLEAYAVGKFDIYEVLAAIVTTFHERFVAPAAEKTLYALSGPEQCAVAPLLAKLYPGARFAMLRRPLLLRVLDPIQALWLRLADRLRKQEDDEDPYEAAWRWRSYGTLLRLVRRRIDAASVVDVGDPTELAAASPLAPQLRPSDRAAGLASFPEASPIFVLGAGRSGTSAIVGAMRAAGIEGFHEGHVFPLLKGMLGRLAEADVGQMRAAVTSAAIRATIERTYGGHGSRTWLDKTPDHAMIDCVPLVREVFPAARFIMMRRHPIAFAESRRRKFSEPLLSAINEWVKCIESWKACRPALPASCYLECDAQSLNDPATQQSLCAFLELDAGSQKRFTDYLASERPELTRMSADALRAFESLPNERRFNLRAILYRMLDSLGEYLEDMSWSPQQKEDVEKLLGALPQEFGYAIHRPANHLLGNVVEWGRQLEEFRYTAEYHERNAEEWAAKSRREFEQYRLKAEHHEKNSLAWAAEAQRQREEAERQIEQYRLKSEHHEKSSAAWAAEAQRQREEAARQREKAQWLEGELAARAAPQGGGKPSG
jgi:hypothetical protein